jgi:hypothetical protein
MSAKISIVDKMSEQDREKEKFRGKSDATLWGIPACLDGVWHT